MLRVVQRPTRLKVVKKVPSPFFHLHAHSKFSHKDAISEVADMVSKAKLLGQPAIALTDHGNMAGAVQLYKAATKAEIAPFTGSEMYFVKDRNDKKAKRYHLGLVAYTTEGYQGMVQISSYSHRRESFHHKPLIDWADLAQFKEWGWLNGVYITTGCFFGLVVQTLITEGYEAAKHVVYRLMQMAETVVELQKHLIDQEPYSEDVICDTLYTLAAEVGAPVVVTQDSHYVEPHEKPIHESLKRLVAFGDDPDEAVFPGDGFHLCDANWMTKHHEPHHMAASDHFLKDLLAQHSLTIPELDEYHYKIPHTVDEPLAELREMAEAQLTVGPHFEEKTAPKAYWDRLEFELDVLDATGMAGYILLVKEFTDWLRANNIFFQARGSAAGSMLCWLAGITPVDPVKYKLLFERFMSKDRTKPPDIDLDIEDQRRDEALAWLKGRFASSQIGTHAVFGIDEEGKGSLMVAFMSKARARNEEIKTYADLPDSMKDEMRVLDRVKPFKSAGKNAAGIIVVDSREYLGRVVPMMGIPAGNGSFSYVSQYYKDDVEALGIVKLDAMGLKNLTALRNAYEMVKETGRDYGVDLESIPLNDSQVYAMIRRGETSGVFQLEGATAQRGCRELKPTTLKDIIVIMALYRPAVMQEDETGMSPKDTYLARRAGRQQVPERHAILTTALKETYGLFVFQEQVIAVLRALGFDPDDLTAFLKAVKASNGNIGDAASVIAGYEGLMRRLAGEKGMTEDDIDFIWSGLRGYAAYGFNRSHATVYGLTAYRTAYFKFHHPLEYATALLQAWAGHEKEPRVVQTVRSMKVRISRPHVNVSGANYSIDRRANAVRKALVSIPKVGPKAAEELALHAPYDSIEDLIKRVDARRVTGGKSYHKDGSLNGTLGHLQTAGALNGMD